MDIVRKVRISLRGCMALIALAAVLSAATRPVGREEAIRLAVEHLEDTWPGPPWREGLAVANWMEHKDVWWVQVSPSHGHGEFRVEVDRNRHCRTVEFACIW